MVTPRLAPAPTTLPPDQRVYAIGDIHGCLDRLQSIHAAIADDLASRPVADALLIHLGDLIDRGPDSARVIAHLMQPFPGHPGVKPPVIRTLMGNHEAMLLAALANDAPRDSAAHWRQNGGTETLASWNLSWRDPPARWADAIPPRQLGFLRGLGLMHRVGGYLFVHAGLRPGVAVARQSREDLLWIRNPFLDSDARVVPADPWQTIPNSLPAVVVHGHTPEPEPVVRANRIGIDTGAVLGGPLTCLVLEGQSLHFIQA